MARSRDPAAPHTSLCSLVQGMIRNLAAMKRILKNRLVAVLPPQRYDALAPQKRSPYPLAHLTIERIRDLLDWHCSTLNAVTLAAVLERELI